MKKASGPYCSKSSWRGRRSCTLGNGLIQVTTLMGGGHISEMRFEESSNLPTINPLWVPPWKTMDSHRYVPERDVHKYGTTTEGKLLSGITGHNICLDYFGSPSAEEAQLGLSQHGEAPSSAWQMENHSVTASTAAVKLKVHLPVAGLHFIRKERLYLNESILYFEEIVANERNADHFFNWTQHVTLGPPLLKGPLSSIAISASRGLTSPDGYDEGKARLAPGKTFRWPKAPLSTSGTADLTRPFSSLGLGYVVGVLVDPSRNIGFVAGINPTEGLVFGYCFLRSDFPWITVWEENLAVEAIPWKGKAQALSLEFGTTPIPAGRRQNFLHQGPLFGHPTAACIPARGKKTVRYVAFLAAVPATFTRLRDVTVTENEILLFAAGSRVPVRLAASHISHSFPPQPETAAAK